MEVRRNDWTDTPARYSEEQVAAVLEECGIEIDSDTTSNFLCFCPYHGNRHTPSCSVSKETGVWLCFNPACDESGTLSDLVKFTKDYNDFQARRLINKHKNKSATSISQRISSILEPEQDFKEFKGDLERMHKELWEADEALEYLHGRGFNDTTLKHFNIGYSQNKRMIVVPFHDPAGLPIGLIGRGVDSKVFKNSTGLPKNKTLWNLHRAKRYETIVICEASFDAMRIHQAGFPNVLATAGGSVSREQLYYLNRYFTSIIIFTDNDPKQIYQDCRKCMKKGLNLCKGHNPGRALGSKIAGGMENKRVRWASYEPGIVYPHGAKDAGEMTDAEISQCIENAVSTPTYKLWGLDVD